MLLSITSLCVLAAAGASKPERLNALSFDNGAVLASESGSYGTETSSWSAWRLTDGDPALGWCSPEGKPTGGTFVWSLDTVWQLDTFTVSNENVQEEGYPGISAKAVDLFVAPAAGEKFSKVGSFKVPQLKKASFPLKGVKAKEVKLVVTGNYGNADYTEIAEVELFGVRTAPVPLASLAGEFQTNYGALRLAQEGTEIFGCWDGTGERSTLWGSVDGRIARVTWLSEDENARVVSQGSATFAVRPDEALWGVWYQDGELAGAWFGPRGGEVACKPEKRGAVARLLKKQGRAVLYGIRFASDSDVPLPESNGALEELARAIAESGSPERLLVEGHTDSTNTDAYNLDLSQRRAQHVVDWLVKHGIAAGRLQSKGFGKSRPVADNRTSQGRALNRRVEVSVMK